ncbi:hypothetical protein NCS57_01250600 [Fusarium keratoplasticum]|uniref:Uncharacterized protein n=1 Tax=Fusarium keratoplasticum TaxID=1328300 RepID=A0ACC0QI18_9HYPO|nr:hypothetical protein NCS57_01250600 [Fusarium keratoplasticum]KAI8655030.1 hypothetical protein NCS57_01250600 [Fusarium keratoplasticum]
MAGDILTLVRRQSTPLQCYYCEYAYQYARLAGRTEALCEDNGFYDLYQTCANCIEDETNSDNARKYIEPKLGRFVDYCASFTSLTNWATMGTASATLATAAEDEQSSATEAASTNHADDSTSRNAPAVTSNNAPSVTGELDGLDLPTSSNASEAKDSSGRNQAWIAGPIVGSVVAVLILAGVGLWWYRRRKRTPKPPSSPQDIQESVHFDKPQLHSECIPRPSPGQVVTTLPVDQGQAHSYSYGEMPANEAPAYELSAEGRRRMG